MESESGTCLNITIKLILFDKKRRRLMLNIIISQLMKNVYIIMRGKVTKFNISSLLHINLLIQNLLIQRKKMTDALCRS